MALNLEAFLILLCAVYDFLNNSDVANGTIKKNTEVQHSEEVCVFEKSFIWLAACVVSSVPSSLSPLGDIIKPESAEAHKPLLDDILSPLL